MTEAKTHGFNISAMQRDQQILDLAQETTALKVRDLRLYYGEKEALHGINMDIPKNRVTAFIGPSGCG